MFPWFLDTTNRFRYFVLFLSLPDFESCCLIHFSKQKGCFPFPFPATLLRLGLGLDNVSIRKTIGKGLMMKWVYPRPAIPRASSLHAPAVDNWNPCAVESLQPGFRAVLRVKLCVKDL